MKDDLQGVFKLAARYYYKKYRERGGTQGRLAKKLGVTQSYISSVISGTKSASLELQSHIADILSGRHYEEFLVIGRRLKNGLDPEIHFEKEADDSVESLITRLSHYVVDHQRIEDELVKMRDFYETIVESLLSGVLVSDANGDITYMNSYMEKIIGLEAEKIIGSNLLVKNERFPDRNLDAMVIFYKKAKEGLEPVFYENVSVVTSGGNRLWITGWMIPLKKENRYDGMIYTMRDMTRLQKLNQSLLATIEYIPYPVAVALQDHKKGPVTSYHMNRVGMELFGLEQSGLTQEHIRISMRKTAEKLENGQEWLLQTARNFKGAEHSTMKIIFKDGRKFTWDSRALRDTDGNYYGRYVTLKEIKRRKGKGDRMELVKG